MNASTRRSVVIACASALLAVVASRSDGLAQEPDHRLVFLGDRAGHRPAQRANVLIPAMRQRGIHIEYTEDRDILASPKLNDYDGIILYANIVEITPEQEAGLLGFVERGKGFVPLHCASFCFQNSNKVVALMGAQFQRHGGEIFATKIVEPDHPIMKGFGGFESWDETYVHRRHNDENRTVLEVREQGMQARDQTSEPWTWVRTQGKGRVFYTAWGHDLRTWNNPGFQNLVERGIRWACGGDPSKVPAFAKPELKNGGEDPQAATGANAGPSQGRPEVAQPNQIAADERFVPPRMSDGPGNLAALEYDDVGPAIPVYNPQQRSGDTRGPRGGGLEHFRMQRPLSAEQSQTYFVSPKGFALELFAAEPNLGPKPISFTWDARGRMWVCESSDYPNEWKRSGRGSDRIRICEDTNGDGKADKFTIFAEELSIPYSIAFYRGGAIVQNGGETIYLKDTDGDDKADVRKTLITGWNMGDTHGAVSNFQYGLDNWIWAMQGYNASRPRFVDAKGVEHEIPTFRQGFFRFKLDQNDPPSVAELEFLRSTNNNTWGLGITEEGLVFGSTANGNPSVFMPIPNRYYERVAGWSAETLRMIADTARFSAVTDKVRQVDHFGAYTAGAGHAVYTARTYPQQWWNRTAFVCEPTGHLVGVFVLERNGADYRSSSPMNLVASRDEWTAPIMAEVGPDGNIWILDWYNYIVQHNPTPPGFKTGVGAAYESDLRDKKHGRIYRLAHADSQNRPDVAPPKLESASPEALVAALRHPTKLWRLHAQRLLVERGKLDVVPSLLKLLQDQSVDEIGLNVGAIHAIGTLQGLGAFDGPESDTVVAALRAALSHPSAGVRRNAILALPLNDASRTALLKSGVLRDSDSQVQLAAVLALSDLPANRESAEAVIALVKEGVASDPWMADAITSAAAMNGNGFMQLLAPNYPRQSKNQSEASDRVVDIVQIVAAHMVRRGLDGDGLARLLEALAAANRRLSTAAVAAISEAWPATRTAELPASANSAIERLLSDAPFEERSDLLRLARLWNAGNTAELQKAHGEALRALVVNGELSDDERIAAARSWVRFDPDSGEVGRATVEIITPQTPQPLLIALLEAAAEGRSPDFGPRLISVYGTLSPQGKQAVLDQLFKHSDTTSALLSALAEGTVDAAALNLEQMAALRAHADDDIRKRAVEVLAAKGSSPNPERQQVLAELLPVAEAKGNPAHGKELFTRHCTPCHTHSGVGGAIAPDLTGMFVHPKKDILGNIIDPSRDVESNFRSYSVISDGKTHTGMIVGESRTTVTIIDTTGKRTVILRDEIEEMYSDNKSLMPDGFERLLSPSDLSDVLEFLATPQRFVPLRLSSVASISSTPPDFGGRLGRGRDDARNRGQGDGGDRAQRRGGDDSRERGRRDRTRFGNWLDLDEWKPVTVSDVPFTLVDPQQGAVKNVLLFGGEASRFARNLPTNVRLPCGMRAKALHLLSGVSIGGYPAHPDKSNSLTVRLHYQGGATEDHVLKNGVHFASYNRREDVPESEFAFAMGEQQMRHVRITPGQTDVIVDVEFIKEDDPTAPIVLAVTAELP